MDRPPHIMNPYLAAYLASIVGLVTYWVVYPLLLWRERSRWR